MNISINIGINQGVVNINSVEMSGKYQNSAENQEKKDIFDGEVKEETPQEAGAEAEEKRENAVVVKKNSIVMNKNLTEIAEELIQQIEDVYTPKKKDNVFLSAVYKQLYHNLGQKYDNYYYANKSERLFYCGSLLVFEISVEGSRKLISTSSCCVRLCPMCAWRRSLKAYREMRITFDYLKKHEEDYKFIFLTLTQRNVKGEQLKEELDNILYAFKRFIQLKQIKKISLGFMRSLEVTYNKAADTYHPHIHVLIYTTNGLYSGRNYIAQKEYRKIWADLLELDYLPQVNVKQFKPKDKETEGKEIAEMCKYSVKPSDYLFSDNKELSEKVTRVLDKSLNGHRLLSYGGDLRKIRKKLLLTDDELTEDELADDDDLIDSVEEKEPGYLELYRWHFGEEKYKKLVGEDKRAVLEQLHERASARKEKEKK